MHCSRSKIPNKKYRPYIYDVKFLALLGAPYIYDISRLRVKYWPEGGLLEPKHVANYVLVTMYVCVCC
jgi:hypothetical protein